MKMFRARMWLILGAVVLLGLSVVPSHAAVWDGNGHDYEVILSAEITRSDAFSAAGAAGGYLATITSAEEEAFIVSLLTSEDRDQYWLGGVLNTATNTWGWYNGDPWSYVNWGEGQPDNWIGDPSYPQIYLAFDSDQNSWGWDDNSGYLLLMNGYILEKEVSVAGVPAVPEPSTLLLLGSGLVGLVGFGRRMKKK